MYIYIFTIYIYVFIQIYNCLVNLCRGLYQAEFMNAFIAFFFGLCGWAFILFEIVAWRTPCFT